MAKKGKPAAIVGHFVNYKPVLGRDVLTLVIEVPSVAAAEVFAALGYPTGGLSIPVAVARLEESASVAKPPPSIDSQIQALGDASRRLREEQVKDDVYETLLLKRARDEQNAVPAAPEQPPKPHPAAQASTEMQLKARHWAEMSPAQQTGVIRNERNFWDFAAVASTDEARDYIRWFCGVKSCADIVPDTEAAAKWAQLQVRYGNWLRKWGRAA